MEENNLLTGIVIVAIIYFVLMDRWNYD